MQYVAGLGDHIADLVRSLESNDAHLRSVCERLRDVGADDVGPVVMADQLADVLARLERRLAAVAQECADGATAARRHISGLGP